MSRKVTLRNDTVTQASGTGKVAYSVKRGDFEPSEFKEIAAGEHATLDLGEDDEVLVKSVGQ